MIVRMERALRWARFLCENRLLVPFSQKTIKGVLYAP